MKNYTRFSSRASLAAVGQFFVRLRIWDLVEKHVQIKQKTVKHHPLAKLKLALINILAGGHGIVEINTRLRGEQGLLRSFECPGWADQSVVSTTLNRCSEETVEQMREAICEINRRHGHAYHHDYERQWQLIDVDLAGMPAGRQGEGVTKGFFSGQKGRRGRKLGRVEATMYEEIVVERLYLGKMRLQHCLQALVEEGEKELDLTPEKRRRTILRLDGGGGVIKDINWVLDRGYGLLVKLQNWQKSMKLSRSVRQWHQDPKVPQREFGWVEAPHNFAAETRQLAVRHRRPDGKWRVRVLVTNLDDATLFWMARQPARKQPSTIQVMQAVMNAYDLRGGGIETANKGSKQGLGITKRNKRSFHAQEMLVLLAQLASNLIIWIRNRMAQRVSFWKGFGHLRMVRDVFHIAGQIMLDAQGKVLQITLARDRAYAARFRAGFAPLLPDNDLWLNLHQI